ncbi:MAG: 6-bladed beta-propeller [Tannerella sp.]|jgi:hypothetical protein|nr:6-bladed beta-propeller [Tannerella sp.]
MKKLFYINLLFIIFRISGAQDTIYVDLENPTYEEIPASRIFEKIEYIPLETPQDERLKKDVVIMNDEIKVESLKITHLKKGLTKFHVTDRYIVALASFDAYLFDRTGRFVRQISSQGKGPDEYGFRTVGFDGETNMVYAEDGGSNILKCINIETNKVESIVKKPIRIKSNKEAVTKISFSKKEDNFYAISAPWRIKENRYIGFNNNTTGKDATKLIVFDKDGNIIKAFRNYLEYEDITLEIPMQNGIFYIYDQKTYFKEFLYNDTVFQVDEKNATPHIVFRLGDKQPSYSYREDEEYNRGKIFITYVYENSLYVVFNYFIYNEFSFRPDVVHTGYYDKKNRKTHVSLNPDHKSGYKLDGIPARFYPTNHNGLGELTGEIFPEELTKHKDEISAENQDLFMNLRENDNPIVIVGKLKD